jgi:hypothetical protein
MHNLAIALYRTGLGCPGRTSRRFASLNTTQVSSNFINEWLIFFCKAPQNDNGFCKIILSSIIESRMNGSGCSLWEQLATWIDIIFKCNLNKMGKIKTSHTEAWGRRPSSLLELIQLRWAHKINWSAYWKAIKDFIFYCASSRDRPI